MPDPFVHLHVASGYSLQYGASHPHTLVERAVEQEMDTLALTDRDGTYGAVKFARACLAGGVRPVLGVDLAYRPTLAGRVGRAATVTLGGRVGRAATVSRPRDPPTRRGPRPRRRVPRRPAAPGHLPGVRPGRLGGGVPAGLGHPPRRRAGEPGGRPRPARPPPRVRRRAGPARPRVGAGRGGDPTPRRPRARGAGPLARAGPVREPPGRAGLPPAPRIGRRLGSRHLRARRPDGRDRPPGRARGGAHQRGPVRRPARRPDRRRPRRRPPAGGARPATRRSRQRRGLPQVRQADAGRRRGDLPAGRAGRDRARGPAAPGPHPRRGRPVRPRPARRPRARRGALPGVRAVCQSWGSEARAVPPTTCSAPGARGRSAAATARRHASGSGSASTTSSR